MIKSSSARATAPRIKGGKKTTAELNKERKRRRVMGWNIELRISLKVETPKPGFSKWLPPVATDGNTSDAPPQIRFITGLAGRDPAFIRLIGPCETLPNGHFTR